MIIASTSTFTLGRFTVHVRPRFDNPAWAVYVVFLGERLVGKQFSIPSLSDCQWLLRTGGVYSPPTAWHEWKAIYRKPGPGRPRKADSARELTEALDT